MWAIIVADEHGDWNLGGNGPTISKRDDLNQHDLTQIALIHLGIDATFEEVTQYLRDELHVRPDDMAEPYYKGMRDILERRNAQSPGSYLKKCERLVHQAIKFMRTAEARIALRVAMRRAPREQLLELLGFENVSTQ